MRWGVLKVAQQTEARPRPDPRAPLAAALSFLFPGLGQAYNGEVGIAWMLAAPFILLVLLVVLVLSIASNNVLVRLLDVRFLVALMALDGLLLVWRLIAISQAYLRRERPHWRRWTTYAMAALIAVTAAMHALPGYWALKAIDTINAVAQGGSGGNNDILHDSFGGAIGIDIPTPSEIPDATTQRINVLLVGIDWLPNRSEHLTDTILVVSLDPTTGQTAMISIPRDMYGVYLPDGRVFNAKINSLLIYATLDHKTYPLGGVGTLKATIGKLLGIKINYFAAINLLGFKQAVDSIGGVDVNVTRAINDPTYWDEYNHHVGFYISVGMHHLDGHTALAYVRSRKGIGDNDFTRAARQQQVLEAIRNKLTAGNILTKLPALLDAVKNTISTDVPSNQIPVLAEAVQNADLKDVQKAVIQPPLVHSVYPGPGGAYILVPDFAAILALGQRLMGPDAGATPTPTLSPTP
jgi:polyisoprenyl-teichoic acid--peptidoglycan teichoic acid transferase